MFLFISEEGAARPLLDGDGEILPAKHEPPLCGGGELDAGGIVCREGFPAGGMVGDGLMSAISVEHLTDLGVFFLEFVDQLVQEVVLSMC